MSNQTEIDLCRELAGLFRKRGGYAIPLKSDEHFTIEQLLEILRERGLWYRLQNLDDDIGTDEAGIWDDPEDEPLALEKGDTLKEALLRACIAVMKEEQSDDKT